jgi:transcription factor C subunit 7
VHDRVDGFLSLFPKVLRKQGEINMKRVLLVSHAATAIVLVRSLVGDRDLPLKYGCCSLSELVPKGEGAAGPDGHEILGAYRGVKLADGSHLKEGASREWGFDDVEIDKGQVCARPSKLPVWDKH